MLVRLTCTVHTNPSQKRSPAKTPFKPEESENVKGIFILVSVAGKHKLFENDSVMLITWLPCPSFPEPNPKWRAIVLFSNSSASMFWLAKTWTWAGWVRAYLDKDPILAVLKFSCCFSSSLSSSVLVVSCCALWRSKSNSLWRFLKMWSAHSYSFSQESKIVCGHFSGKLIFPLQFRALLSLAILRKIFYVNASHFFVIYNRRDILDIFNYFV